MSLAITEKDDSIDDLNAWAKKVRGDVLQREPIETGDKNVVGESLTQLIRQAFTDEDSLGWSKPEASDSSTRSIRTLTSDVTTVCEIEEFVVGNAVYPFRAKNFFAITGDFRVKLSYPLSRTSLTGRGSNVEEAIDDFIFSFHVRFQQLLCKSILSMSDEERTEWDVFTELIDIEEHKRRTPIELRKIGTVVSHSPFQLQWLEDDHPTLFDLSNTPSKLASFNVGDEFEAVVEFNRGTREVTRILSVGATPDAILDDDAAEDSEQVEPLDWADF